MLKVSINKVITLLNKSFIFLISHEIKNLHSAEKLLCVSFWACENGDSVNNNKQLMGYFHLLVFWQLL